MRTKVIASILCLFTAIVYLLPQMQFSQPNFLDVAETWALGKDIVGNTLAVFSNTERFRPLYVFERLLLNMLFSYHPLGYFLFFSLLLGTTIFVGFCILRRAGKDWIVYALIGFLFLISPVTVDTYWRLGTAENLFALSLVGSIYALTEKRYTQLLVWLYILMGSKETAVFVIPVFLATLFYKKQYWLVALVTVGYVGFSIKIYSLIQYVQEHAGSYTSLFSAGIESLGDMLWYYTTSYIFYTTLFLLGCALMIYRASKRFELGHVFILLILSNLLSLLFFRNKFQPYYYFPVLTMLLLFLGREMHLSAPQVKRMSVLYVLALFILLGVPGQTWERVTFWQRDYAADGALIALIEETKHTNIYVFERDYRPELTPALTILNERKSGTNGLHQRIIKRVEEAQPDDLLLCSKTFFGDTACKWSVIRL